MGAGRDNTLFTSPTTATSSESEIVYVDNDPSKVLYSWTEVRRHNKKGDCWIVVNENVYNMSQFQQIHPGGSKIVAHYSGQDASEVFQAFHKDYERVNYFKKLYHIGRIDPDDPERNAQNLPSRIETRNAQRADLRNLRKIAMEMKLFEPSYAFFFAHGFQIVFFHILGYLLLLKFGGDPLPFTIALICHILAQGQADWTEHDYGHSSLFAQPKYNRYLQMFFLGILKGASADWWNFMHNQHHAKPNVIDKDPDVRIDPIFVLGKLEPVRKAEKNVKYNTKNLYPYTIQYIFFPFFAPLLFPVYFQIMTFRYAITRRKYADLASMLPFYLIHFGISFYALSFKEAMLFYVMMRFVESSWFTWVSQCNHIVMDIHDDEPTDSWLALQLKATCNITHSRFNDWFTGHLNFQIEHHLFPTMPRHNYVKIQPLVQSLCKKYDIKYVVKPLGQAFRDILMSLKKSGDIWEEAYVELKGSL